MFLLKLKTSIEFGNFPVSHVWLPEGMNEWIKEGVMFLLPDYRFDFRTQNLENWGTGFIQEIAENKNGGLLLGLTCAYRTHVTCLNLTKHDLWKRVELNQEQEQPKSMPRINAIPSSTWVQFQLYVDINYITVATDLLIFQALGGITMVVPTNKPICTPFLAWRALWHPALRRGTSSAAPGRVARLMLAPETKIRSATTRPGLHLSDHRQ